MIERFDSDGVEIAYEVTGEGEPILLIHGFASNGRVNWRDTGWIDTLVNDGRKVITIDNRGHGESEKLYRPSAYTAPIMAADSFRLIDYLNIARADVMGYSMGARIAAFLTIAHPERVRSAIFAGLAENMIKGVGGAETIARALEADSLDAIVDAESRAFRLFAEQTGSDLKALAACMRSARRRISKRELAEIAVPVLVAVGSRDEIAGKVEPLVAAIPGAQGLVIPGRDHMRAVGDKVFKSGVLSFLASLQN